MKKILGLDLGTNSIGWALVEQDFKKKEGQIDGLGSRIIPMSQDVLGKFDSGVSISQTAERTGYRGVRRLYDRDHTRRERLHRILNILDFLPSHYATTIDFDKRPGQFKEGLETKLNYILKPRPKNKDDKDEFIFISSFLEMAREFEANGHSGKIPYDWTLYYLRKKALAQAVSKEELAWIILNFNQKRGYYQARGEEADDNPDKLEEFHELKVVKVEADEVSKGKDIWYNVILENGWIYRRKSKESLDSWVGKDKEFIVTTNLEKDGSFKKDKDGEVKRSFRAVDSEKDWIAIKAKSEQDIERSGKTVGVFIYDTLLENPKQKIRGKLVKTIERKFYKDELKRILETQAQKHPEFKDRELYDQCVQELYPRNESHQANIKDRDLVYLLMVDIIFYQRPLKSKKSSIANCQYEFRTYKDKDGNEQIEYKKGIPRSHPLFQEFRLWQFLKNLKIKLKDGKTATDVDVTDTFFATEDDWVNLFDFLSVRKEVEQKDVIKYLVDTKLIEKKEKNQYRWNYVEDRPYPCGETRAQFLTRLKKIDGLNTSEFLTPEVEYHLWHIIYSVKDPKEFKSALGKFARKYEAIGEGAEKAFVDAFGKIPPYPNDYGSYSEKALKKIVPLMRRGRYWNEEVVCYDAKERIDSIMERLSSIDFNRDKIDQNVVDDEFPKQLLKSFIDFKDANPLQGLNTYQSCYAVYARHSEASSVVQWKTTADIDNYLFEFKQHSLRNPIVEQVVTETLRVVRDIWDYYGEKCMAPYTEYKDPKSGKVKKYYHRIFDEIHVELGRAMKNPKKKREQMTLRNLENQNRNERVKRLLTELMNDSTIKGDVRPYSPSHQEILKIYEEGVYQNLDNVDDDIEKIRKSTSPTPTEINRYKLWLEQGYISPYTGKTIPLSRLFTTDYQIEHIIPQSRYFDDSLSNKVICESAVNGLKDNSLAYEFIRDHHGEIVELGNGESVKVLELDAYKSLCAKYFRNNRGKLKKLLSEDIPEGFIERQLNDSRYISKLVKGLLSNVVREENELEATSKHIVTVTGAITSQLKQDWGLNDKWNELVAPRFKRLNELTGTNDYGYWDEKINAFRTQVPDSVSKGFSKKRIDHRHHALDALIVACTTKDHVSYITSLNTARHNHALVGKLRVQEDIEWVNKKTGEITKRTVARAYHQPWSHFTADAYNKLSTTVVSFKQNLRVINKTNNKYLSYKDEKGKLRVDRNGKPQKALTKQVKGDNWAIRKPLHKETVSGKVVLTREKATPITFSNALNNWKSIVNKDVRTLVKVAMTLHGNDLKKVKTYFKSNPIIIENKTINKVKVFETFEATAVRTELSDKFTRKHLESITDTGIQTILENHLKNYVDENGKERFDLAFNQDGIEDMNRNIVALNNGRPHQPIKKVRIYEVGSKFSVGQSGNKKDKYVEAAKGTNLFFAVYWNEEKQKREYDSIPLNVVIEHQKQVAHLPKDERTPIPADPEKGKFLFSLSPNDLVYVPTEDEMENPALVDFNTLSNEQVERVYKMVSSSGSQCFFIRNDVASSIANKYEYSTLNKMEKSIANQMIKSLCWKIQVSTLGNVTNVNR